MTPNLRPRDAFKYSVVSTRPTSSALLVTSLRVCAVVAAATAVFAPSCGVALNRFQVVMVDVSGSMRDRGVADAVANATRDLDRGERVVAIAFGDGARAGTPRSMGAIQDESWSGLNELATPSMLRATRYADALRAAASAAAAARYDERMEAVLVTDGRATDGADGHADAAYALRAAGCASLRVDRVLPECPGSRVLHVRGPGSSRALDSFSVSVQGTAAPGGARVELVEDARVLAVRTVPAGAFDVRFPVAATQVGERAFAARIADGDIGEARAHVVVATPSRALVIGEPTRSGALSRALGRAVDMRDGRDAAGVDAALAAHGLVVLDGVPASEISREVESALVRHVQGGGGLLVLGGPGGYALGGWGGRPLDELVPLRSIPPDGPGLLLYLALDGSGSMADPWPGGGGTRDQVVRDAARELIRSLPRGTRVALRRFAGGLRPNETPVAPLEWTGEQDEHGLLAAIDAIDALGGPSGATHLLPVLQEAQRLCGRFPSTRVHALVFTDARTAEETDVLRESVSAIVRAGGSATVVAPADDAVAGVRVAVFAGGGSFRTVSEAPEVARAFLSSAAEAQVVSPLLERRRPRLTEGAEQRVPGAEDVPGAIRMHRTFATPDSDVIAVASKGEPVAAVGRAGLGAVACYASRVGDSDWARQGDGRLARALAATVAGAARGALRVERDGGELFVAVSLPAPRVAADALRLRVRTPAGTSDVELRPAPHGLLRARVAEDASFATVLDGEGRAIGSVGLDVPAAPEAFFPDPIDVSGLASLVGSGPARGGRPLAPWLAGLAVLLLVVAHAAAPRTAG